MLKNMVLDYSYRLKKKMNFSNDEDYKLFLPNYYGHDCIYP